jgi:predicted secreted protein
MIIAMNKQKTIHGKNTVPGLLLCVLAWMLAILPAHAQGGHWIFDDDNNPFENYMTINAYIVFNGTEVESDQFEIAAFIGGECRGTYRLAAQTWVGHNYPCFLSVWGKTSETGQALTIKVYDHSTGTEYEANEKPLYEYNGNLGGFDDDGNPVPLYQLTIASDPNYQVYNLSVVPSQNGSLSADVTSGLPDTVITLTLTPATGYEPDVISAYKTNEAATTVALSGTGNTRTLIMPAHNVTAEASFKKTAALIAVETAATLIAGESYTVTQEYAENEPALKVWLADYIHSLPGMAATGIMLTAGNISITSFTAALAGTENSVSGTNGSFGFTVSLSLGEIQQTTPEKSGVITAKEYVEPAKWSVTITQLSNGTVTAAPDVAEAGETITLTIAPTSGHELKSISAYKTGETATAVTLSGSGNTRTFTMPAYPVTVSAVFGKTQATLDAEAIATAVSLIENATYSFLQSDGNTEEAIKEQLIAKINGLLSGTGITITADDIALSGFTAAVAGSAASPNGANGSFSFTVSLTKGSSSTTTTAKNGTIAATVYTPPAKYSVTISQSTNGTVTASPDVAEAGETITLTVSPTSGYELKSIAAYKTGEQSTAVSLSGSGNTRTFAMPAYSVTVSVVFGKTQATLDAEAIATAVSLIENATYSFLQSDGNTEEDIIRQLVAQINDLLSGTGITVTADDITLSNFTPATAGSTGSLSGIDGGFLFSVNLHKNNINHTTDRISGVITATRFTAIGDISQEKGLNVYVQNGTLYAGGLTQGKAWNVYNIFGAPVYGGIAGSGKAEVNLQNRGVYIVKSGSKTIKVMY